jgi:protein-disulfide isomerase
MIKLSPPFNPSNDHFHGNLEAPIELLCYSDFQCNYSGALFSTIKFLQEVLGKELRYVFRHFPLQNLHLLSVDAAVATEVAYEHDKFWQMHDLLFMNQTYLTRAAISGFIDDLQLNSYLFNDSKGYKRSTKKVLDDFTSGIRSGVEGTPTLFINGIKYNGIIDFENLYQSCTIVTNKVKSISTRSVSQKFFPIF